MKTLIFLVSILLFTSCEDETKQTDATANLPNKINLQAELNLIEETRNAFQLAIKEKRYGDLKQYSTTDFKGVSPGSEDWLEYKRIREKPMGKFSYDSI
ncbi:hypothetical protein HX109_12900 [Galbibacter sp. BG1]|uniref:hypothetical protein n=1 Tax=Galbibacter sp. BG1 TaxID=1170699 RepID=UPI0015BA06E3|nr:hypothetical protein [Galbibacter sp. BG1]QLE02411.1 hypothetical protein HX109_12900 [Galbibacter sp. BG1]